MSHAKMIKAIIFDVGGVIYLGKQKANRYMRERLGLDRDSWKKATEQIWENLLIGAINEEVGMLKMANNLGVKKDKLKKLWVKAFKVRFVLNKNLLKLIRKLKKNYRIAMLSDQWSIPYEILITKEIKSNFNAMIFSYKEGVRKPQVKIYRKMLKKLKLKPQECVFIDNEQKNITPAKKLGMKTILFKNNKQLNIDLQKLGVKI